MESIPYQVKGFKGSISRQLHTLTKSGRSCLTVIGQNVGRVPLRGISLICPICSEKVAQGKGQRYVSEDAVRRRAHALCVAEKRCQDEVRKALHEAEEIKPLTEFERQILEAAFENLERTARLIAQQREARSQRYDRFAESDEDEKQKAR